MRYHLTAHVTVSAMTEIEAESEDEAMEIAEERFDVVLGGIGSGADYEEQWVIEDADGTPENIRIEEVDAE